MEENLCTPKKIKLLVTIVNRGKGEKLTELYRSNNISYNIICLGRGTANSDILEYLGIGESEKDVVISVVHEEDIENVMQKLNDKLNFSSQGTGIAFTIPISSVDRNATLKYISGLFK